MKVFYPFLYLLFSTALLSAQAESSCNSCNDYVFKQNKGQWDKKILYKTDLKNGALFVEQNAITFHLFDTRDMLRIRGEHHKPALYDPDIDYTFHLHAFKMKFKGAANTKPAIGNKAINEYFNYYIGNNPNLWVSNVTGFTQVSYSDLYHGISLRIATENGAMKYIYDVAPQADVQQIQIEFEGTDGLNLDKGGNLHINTSVGEVQDLKPYAYQLVNGKQVEVPCSFSLSGNVLSYRLPNGYNKQQPLVIDPTLIFSTFSGSFANNFGFTATYDNQGNAFTAGSVFNVGFPVTTGAYQVNYIGGPNETLGTDVIQGSDIAITKYNATGTQRLYSTYLGGYGQELPHSLVVNANDELYVLGTAGNNTFPVTANAYKGNFSGGPAPNAFIGIDAYFKFGSDIFITRFNAAGTQLLASTFVGGTHNDGLNYRDGFAYQGQGLLRHNYADEVRGEIDIDKNGNVFVASSTYSANFPRTAGSFQTGFGGGQDACVFKMDATLSSMIWSTTFGGEKNDAAYSITFSSNDDIYVAGGTVSDTFPVTAGALQAANGGGNADGYIVHIDKTGQQLLQSTYYGKAAYDQVYFVEQDKQNNVYVFGQADQSGTHYITNAGFSKPDGGQFITKFTPALDSIIWSTSFGRGLGRSDISPTAFLVDVCNSVYVAGWGSNISPSTFLGTTGMLVTTANNQSTTDGRDFYLMVMADDASSVTYDTYFGGPQSLEHVDGGTSRFDKRGIVYQAVCGGCGGFSDFPTTDSAVSRVNNASCNNAVFKFNLDLPLIVANFTSPPACRNVPIAFTNLSTAQTSPGYQWNFGDGSTSTQVNPTHSYAQSGLFTVTLVINDPSSCNLSDTLSKQIFVLGGQTNTTLPAVTLCSQQSVQIGVTPSNNPAITYSWTPAATLSSAVVSNPFASPAVSTTYTLLVSNGLCADTFTQSVNIVTPDAITLFASGGKCSGDTIELRAISAGGGPVITSYTWQPANTIIAGGNTGIVRAVLNGNTTFSVSALTENGCSLFDTIIVNIHPSSVQLDAYADPDTINFGDTTQLFATTAFVSSFSWTTDATLSATNVLDPYAYPPTTHTYYISAKDDSGCAKTDSVIVFVLRTPCAQSNLFIPNGFSPNGDGKNDLLYVRGNNITKLLFILYDRWGQKVFETTDMNAGWDGIYKGKKLDPAVFAYYVEGDCESGESFNLKGNVTLFR